MSLLGPDRRIVSREVVPRAEAVCISCHKPFKFGSKGDPGVNVYSRDGGLGVGISGMCELCFDECTAEPEEEPEDDGDFCPGCNPEPTFTERETGRCGFCGKELP